jgi:hypothetical protein
MVKKKGGMTENNLKSQGSIISAKQHNRRTTTYRRKQGMSNLT